MDIVVNDEAETYRSRFTEENWDFLINRLCPDRKQLLAAVQCIAKEQHAAEETKGAGDGEQGVYKGRTEEAVRGRDEKADGVGGETEFEPRTQESEPGSRSDASESDGWDSDEGPRDGRSSP